MERKALYQYLWDKVQQEEITDTLAKLILDISFAGKLLTQHIEESYNNPISDKSDTINPNGEKQHCLDIKAHNIYVDVLKRSRVCQFLVSEESENEIKFDCSSLNQQYTVYLDPLDGTSNVDCNAPIGSIFSIYNCIGKSDLKNQNLKGKSQIAAGYIIYSTTVMLVLTLGNGVYCFTYDKKLGEFILSHPKLRIPKDGNTYSINEGNYEDFPMQIKGYLSFCKNTDNERGIPFQARYIGSMIADIHRILFKGGIFMYPSTSKHSNGKLRLMYECNPMAMIIEQAGGLAVDGMRPILDTPSRDFHQKTPFIAGSYKMVKEVLLLYKNESINNHWFYSC